MFISTAYAQTAPGAGGELISVMPFVLIMVVIYFFMIRPQQKRAKEHKETLSAIRRGDRIVTGGGIIGTVSKVGSPDEELLVEIADNVKVRVLRSTVTTVLTRSEPPAKAASAPAASAAAEEKKEGLLDKLKFFGRK